MVLRQPFPGPGLAIRIIGEVTAERLDTLREADWIVIDEIKAAGLYRSAVAVVRDPDARALGGRDGRRADVRERRRDPRGHLRGRDDRRLGEAARTTSWARSAAASSTRSRASIGSSTTSAPSRRRPSSGSERRDPARHTLTDGTIGRRLRRGRIWPMADPTPTTPRGDRPPSAPGAPRTVTPESVVWRRLAARRSPSPTQEPCTAARPAAIVRDRGPRPRRRATGCCRGSAATTRTRPSPRRRPGARAARPGRPARDPPPRVSKPRWRTSRPRPTRS